MYALSLGDDGRVLSATLPEYAPAGAVQVEALPEGDISDYKYVDGAFVLEPLPTPAQPIDDMTLLQAQVQALSERNDFMEDCIAEMAMQVYQ